MWLLVCVCGRFKLVHEVYLLSFSTEMHHLGKGKMKNISKMQMIARQAAISGLGSGCGCEAESKKVERNSSLDFASDGNFEKVSLNSFTTR